MKRQLSQLLSLTLALEMMLAPLSAAYAEAPKKSALDTINSVLDTGMNLGNQAGLINSGMNGAGGPYGQDFQMYEAQKVPVADTEVFNSQLLYSHMPGLQQYMAANRGTLDCPVLKPLNIVEPDVCDPSGSGIFIDPNNSNASMPYIQSANEFKRHMKDIKNLYKDSTSEYFGAKSCMSKASNLLENFFKYRVNELDKLSNELNRMHAEFMKGSEQERTEIATQTAMLDGSDPALTKDVDAKLLENSMKDMQKDFENSACPTIKGFKSDLLAKNGLKKSYTSLDESINLKSPNGFSGASYTSDHARVVADLTNMSNIAVTQFKDSFKSSNPSGTMNGFMGDFLKSVNVPSKTGASSLVSAGNLSELISSFNADKDLIRMTKQQEDVVAAIGSSEVTNLLADQNASSFDTKLTSYTNRLKQACLTQALSEKNKSLQFIKDNSYTPGKTSFADKNSTNSFDSVLANILQDPSLSPEKKIEKLNAAKKMERRVVRQSSWFNVEVLGKDGNKETKTIAKGNLAATDFYTAIIQNCDAQFKSNKSGSSMTKQQAVETLQNLRQDYKKLAEKQSTAIKEAISRKFISCESSKIANSVDKESCSPDNFDTSKPGFCANGALSCSTNMQACTNKTKAQVEKIEKSRTAKVSTYNVQVKSHVAALKQLYDKTQKLYEEQAKAMASGFGGIAVAGFSLPGGIVADPKTGKLESFEGHGVMLEDPAKAIDAFKNNVALLKAEVTKFQDGILAGFRKHMDTKREMYAEVAEQAGAMEGNCTAAVTAANNNKTNIAKEQDEQLKKFGQKLSIFCKEYSKFAGEHPNGACASGYDDIVEAGLEAAAKLGSPTAGEAISEYKIMCDGYNNESSEENFDDMETMCKKVSSASECKKYEEIKSLGAESTKCTEDVKKNWIPKPGNKTDDCVASDYKTNGKCELAESSCSELIATLEERLTKKYTSFKKKEKVAASITSGAPEYCVSDNDDTYRYNGKVFLPGGLGQQNGLASGAITQ